MDRDTHWNIGARSAAACTWLVQTNVSADLPQVTTLAMVAAVAVAIALSWSWPIGQDAPLMQYCAFLMDHGKVPYRDVVDMNSFGAYFSSWLEIHALGYSDLGWRVYDLLFLALGASGIWMIARSFGKLEVVLASCMLAIFHIQEGPLELGQRDFQFAILALVGCGLVCEGMRHCSGLLLFASGVIFSAGSTIKLSGILFVPVFFLLIIAFDWRRHSLGWSARLAVLIGSVIPWGGVFLYLHHVGGLTPFLVMSAKFLPLYSKMGRVSATEPDRDRTCSRRS